VAGMTSNPTEKRPPLLQAVRVLVFIGATSFGQSLVAYFNRELNERRGWISEQELLEDLSIAQILPGAVGGNLTVLVGRRLGGVWGAVLGTAAIYGPGALLMLLASALYVASGRLTSLEPLFHGLALAAAGIAAGNSLAIAGTEIRSWRAIALAPLAFLAVVVFHLQTILVVLGVGGLGIVLFRDERTPKRRHPQRRIAASP
jgi:chromate transporter